MTKDAKGHGSNGKAAGGRVSVWDAASPAQRAKWASAPPARGPNATAITKAAANRDNRPLRDKVKAAEKAKKPR